MAVRSLKSWLWYLLPSAFSSSLLFCCAADVDRIIYGSQFIWIHTKCFLHYTNAVLFFLYSCSWLPLCTFKVVLLLLLLSENNDNRATDFIIPCKKSSCPKISRFCAIIGVFGKEGNVIKVAWVKRGKVIEEIIFLSSYAGLNCWARVCVLLHQLHQQFRINCWVYSCWMFDLTVFSKCILQISLFSLLACFWMSFLKVMLQGGKKFWFHKCPDLINFLINICNDCMEGRWMSCKWT